MSAPETPLAVTAGAASPLIETASIGNRAAGPREVTFSSSTATVTYLGVRWDGDKVRGIRMRSSDGTQNQCGGIDDGNYALTEFTFMPGETLAKAWLRDSGYGYRSLRQVEFVTSKGRAFKAGPNGFDNEVALAVEGALLAGFHAWVNSDNFVNALALLVRRDAPPKPRLYRPWFETNAVGNRNAANHQFMSAAEYSTAQSIQMRWDGDKIRGVRMTMRDGTVSQAGGIDDTSYTLTSYTFAEDETLQTLAFSSSGYGYGSFRRVEFTTSKGGRFAAGPEGIDDLVAPPVAGACFVGFHAWVNVDNFVNAMAFCCTNDAPWSVALRNFSPWACSYSNGTVIIDGKPLLGVVDFGTNVSGVPGTRRKRALQLTTTSGRKGYVAFDGNAQLAISIFADATFEAKFAVDEGDGSVYGPIDGQAPATAKPVLLEALVRKYAPIYMLNVDEVYWQTNIDAFLPHMILQKVNDGRPGDFFTGPLDRNVLAAQAQALGANNSGTGACLRTRADLNQPSDTQDWFNGTRPQGAAQLTTYAVAVEGRNGRLDIVYWWFFNYNQGKTVAGTSWGNHVSDWEHVKVQLAGVDFAHPQNERIQAVMYDHHGDQETHAPGDGMTELNGRQVLVHLANGDHECYPKAGVYDRPMGCHDYCKENAYRFDTRAGNVEVYSWTGSDFAPLPAGATSAFRDPAWIRYRGRWGNWQRGDLMGQVARLESGPEGIFRPGEYAMPA
jgi:hypothetical protein